MEEFFWFKWQKGGEAPLGFRMKPDSINNNMWFLFTNALEDSLQINREAAQATESYRWMVKTRRADPWFCPGQYFNDKQSYTYLKPSH